LRHAASVSRQRRQIRRAHSRRRSRVLGAFGRSLSTLVQQAAARCTQRTYAVRLVERSESRATKTSLRWDVIRWRPDR
jgi:hypothetical protein